MFRNIKLVNRWKYTVNLYQYLYSITRLIIYVLYLISTGGRRDRDRMVVGFTTTYAIIACHHWCCEFESRSGRGVQHYMIKLVSDLRQVGNFLRFPPQIKLTPHDITELLLKVALNTIKKTKFTLCILYCVLCFMRHHYKFCQRKLMTSMRCFLSNSLTSGIVNTVWYFSTIVKPI